MEADDTVEEHSFDDKENRSGDRQYQDEKGADRLAARLACSCGFG
jgi:hypothetical protein